MPFVPPVSHRHPVGVLAAFADEEAGQAVGIVRRLRSASAFFRRRRINRGGQQVAESVGAIRDKEIIQPDLGRLAVRGLACGRRTTLTIAPLRARASARCHSARRTFGFVAASESKHR